jgi:ADP-heptose:LPS heptosyltransferase
VVVTGSAGERDLAARVVRLAGLPGSAVLAGRTDTGALAGLVAGARLLISGDTGIAHLATAYGTPSVLLFGPMSPTIWGPPPDRPWHRALWHPSAGRPDGPGPHPALRAIEVPEVLAAVGEVQRAARQAGGRRSDGRVGHAVAAQ